MALRVGYGDDVFRRLAFDAAFQPNTWRAEVLTCYRRRHQSLVAAKDRDDLRQVACLDLRTESDRAGTRSSIRLVDEVRLLLDFALESDTVTVVDIVEANTREVTP